jgi:hypothetical protein
MQLHPEPCCAPRREAECRGVGSAPNQRLRRSAPGRSAWGGLRGAAIAVKESEVRAVGAGKGWWVLAALVAFARVEPAAAAELSVAAPRACAIADEIAFRAERALGQSLKSAANVRCSIHIAHASGVYAARLELDSPGSARPARLRSFRAPTCAKLTDLLALAVVLAVGGEEDASAADSADTSVGLAPTPGAVEGAPEVAGVAAGGERAPDADAAPSPSISGEGNSQSLRLGAHAALVGDAGTLPRVGLGPRLGVFLGWDGFELRASGTYLLPREASIDRPNVSPARAEVGLFTGAIDLCAPRLFALSSAELGACAGAELGWLWGSSSDVSVPDERGTLWSAAGADLVGGWALGGRVGLDLSVGARMPLERDELAIAGLGRVHQTARIIGRLGLGVSVDFDAAPGRRR